MSYLLNKHQFLEDLNACSGIEQFLSTAIAELVKVIDAKIEESEHKNDFAVPSVGTVLYHHSQPLVHPQVKLKLLASLGMLPSSHYEDILSLFKLAKIVYSSGTLYDFNSPGIFYEFKELNIIHSLNSLEFEPILPEEGIDPRPRLRLIETQKKQIKHQLSMAIYLILFDLYKA